MIARRKIGRIALALGLLACGIASALRSNAPVEQPAAGPKGMLPEGFAGNASCSARGCHGGTEPKEKDVAQQNEYTFCLIYDKHAQAYSVLKDPRAERMARNLRPTNPGGEVIPPHLDKRCLACHTTPEAGFQNPNQKVDIALTDFRKDGISCEACHGPANKKDKPWLAAHTEAGWGKKTSAREKAAYGMIEIGDVAVQAKICAGCHVGAAPDKSEFSGLDVLPRDVNHDIMAAGHPRLNFELSAFRLNMPPHWNVKLQSEDAGMAAAREAKLWAVGRLVSAIASLELLKYRARQSERWPEFAEYSCLACHASLNQVWRARDYKRSHPVGAQPYDPWYGAWVPKIGAALGASNSSEVAGIYRKLSEEMSKPMPSTRIVTNDATDLIKPLNDWLNTARNADCKPDRLLKALAEDVKDLPTTWEETTQFVLGVAALKHSDILAYERKKASDPELKKPANLALLDDLFQSLAFPRGYDSPRGIEGPFRSRAEVAKHFAALLKTPGE